MSTVHLVVADANQEYVDLLFQYIRTSEEHHKFILKSFSTSENVTRFLDQHKGAYLLLVTPELLPPELHKKDNVMLLVEDHQPHEEYITINKFQPLNLLLSKVWAFHLEKNGLAISHQFLSKKTKIVSFYSASGGAGKTTAAINFCNQAASQDYRVFYLNLELYHSVHSLFPTEEKAEGLDTLLYYVKSRSKQLVAKIEELKQTQTFTKIDYLSPANGQEMLDLTKQDIEFLLQGFIDLGSYDFIVLDLESSLHERIVQSLQMSDLIIWVTVDDLFQVDKSKQSIEH
ncbi:AAA family ATPase [Caldalkalibacillus mannanilyticus]|uniref:AAA family ATPase n=1 Tax=Caldalkalibacillus mannanilyticus TaxID=1418 RepID=UPI00046A0412|nr:AAA family ATPase [Caldalkalibacillus mannanilyticus]